MNKFRFFLSALICMLSLSSAWAYESVIDGVTWTWDTYTPTDATEAEAYIYDVAGYSEIVDVPSEVSNGEFTYTVTSVGYPDASSDGYSPFKNKTDIISVTLPTTLRTIAYGAFLGCTGLTSVEIPNSVTSIGSCAFNNCISLTSIEIPNSVTNIGQGAFAGCSSLTSVVIPNSVTSIGSSAFSYCISLTSIEIPNSVTSIGSGAFNNCISLTSIEIPNSVTSIEYATFSGCSGLTSIVIGNSVASIGQYAFNNCISLTSIEIPNSVTSIGYGAFSFCENLTSVVIPSSLSCIDNDAFVQSFNYDKIYITDVAAWCNISGLINLMIYGARSKTLYINNVEASELVIPEGVTTIPSGAFFCFKNITSVTIPNSVTSIGNEAFNQCIGLTSIEIPNSVTSLGAAAFGGCTSLASAIVGNSVTSIEYMAFVECSSLTSVEIPNSVTSIGSDAFARCTSLTSVDVPSSVTSIDSGAFADCSSLASVEIPNSVTSIGWEAFKNCGTLVSVGDLSACTSIDVRTFQGCTSLVSVGDMSSCTRMDSQAFYGCTSLVSVGDLSSCEAIGDNAFEGCSSLESIGDLSACKSIGDAAFRYCSSLSSIGNLPACTSIGSQAFLLCTSLKSVGNLPACTEISHYTFEGCSSLESVGDLSSCTSIGGSAFAGCSSLESIGELPACTEIASTAFNDCSSINELKLTGGTVATLEGVLPENMTVMVPETLLTDYRNAPAWNEMPMRIIAVGSQTEYDVEPIMEPTGSGLLTVIGLENMGNVTSLKVSGNINAYDIFNMRNNMPNLHKLDLSDAHIKATEDNFPYYGTTTTVDNVLGDYAFYQQKQLTKVILPADIVTIGWYAFQESGLTSVTIPEKVTQIGNGAFESCNLYSVLLPDALTYIGNQAFRFTQLVNLELPKNIETIGWEAFGYTPIKALVLPSKLSTIESGAFTGCHDLMSVKASAIDSHTVTMSDDSFGRETYNKATLYIPYDEETGWDATFWNYYYNTQWGAFKIRGKWLPTYEEVLIGGDYTQETGTIPGDHITGEIGNNGGYIAGDGAEQDFDEVTVDKDGNNGPGGSIIVEGEGNLNISVLNQRINVAANEWYFFCFPFDINIADIDVKGEYVLYRYDGQIRAENGRGGWVRLETETKLNANEGYIFQTNTACKINVPVNEPKFSSDDKFVALQVYPANNKNDASWNLVGNPYLAYFNLEDLGYTAPITYWNGTSYEAARPGDDDYAVKPYQAFFVQTTDASNGEIAFPAEGCETYLQSQNTTDQARIARAQSKINPERLIQNLVISDGENEDKTRVVFNDKQQMEYEPECDAAKFMSSEDVPQLYSVYNNVQYAINERPVMNGDVQLGFKATKAGTYSIAMRRMDTPMLLKDNELGVTFDFANGEYTFDAQAGSNEHRFTLLMNGDPTAVKPVTVGDAESATYFNTAGQRTNVSSKGIVIEKAGNSVKKVLNK